MKNLSFITVLWSVLLLLNQNQAFAQDCPSDKILMWNGSCQTPSGDCGSNCTYTLDSDGNLKITGSGQGRINDTFKGNKSIKNLTIESGISTIGHSAFYNTGNIQNVNIGQGVSVIEAEAFDNIGAVNSFIMPDTITSIGIYSLQSISGAPVVVPPNAAISGRGFWTNSQLKYCTAAQMNVCLDEGRSSDKVIKYEKNGDLFYVYDQENNISEIYAGYGNFSSNVLKEVTERDSHELNDDGSVLITDKNGMPMSKYSAEGRLLAQYSYNSDGSVKIYDANGKIIGIQGKRIFSVDEATALVSGNGKNTFSIRYR